MRLCHYLTKLEKLIELLTRNDFQAANDSKKLYRRLSQNLHTLLSQDCNVIPQNERLQALTASIGVYGRLRRRCRTNSPDAASLFHYLFTETGSLLLSSHYDGVDPSDGLFTFFKSGVSVSIRLLRGFDPEERLLHALESLPESYWRHPVLLAIISGDPIAAEEALKFVNETECEELLRLRIRVLLGMGGVEPAACHLIGWCVRGQNFKDDIALLAMHFELLHSLGRFVDITERVKELSCCVSLEVFKKLQETSTADAVLTMAQTFTVYEWFRFTDPTCGKELLRNWMILERKDHGDGVDGKLKFTEACQEILKLSRDGRQLAMVLLTLQSLFGREFIEMCTDVALRAIRKERFRLFCAQHYLHNTEQITDATQSVVSILECLVRLYDDHLQIKLSSLLSAFSLSPSSELYESLEACCKDIDCWPPFTPVAPAEITNKQTYSELLEAVDLLRNCSTYRPSPPGWTALRGVLHTRFHEAGMRYQTTSRGSRWTQRKLGGPSQRSRKSDEAVTLGGPRRKRSLSSKTLPEKPADIPEPDSIDPPSTAAVNEKVAEGKVEMKQMVAGSLNDDGEVSSSSTIVDVIVDRIDRGNTEGKLSAVVHLPETSTGATKEISGNDELLSSAVGAELDSLELGVGKICSEQPLCKESSVELTGESTIVEGISNMSSIGIEDSGILSLYETHLTPESLLSTHSVSKSESEKITELTTPSSTGFRSDGTCLDFPPVISDDGMQSSSEEQSVVPIDMEIDRWETVDTDENALIGSASDISFNNEGGNIDRIRRRMTKDTTCSRNVGINVGSVDHMKLGEEGTAAFHDRDVGVEVTAEGSSAASSTLDNNVLKGNAGTGMEPKPAAAQCSTVSISVELSVTTLIRSDEDSKLTETAIKSDNSQTLTSVSEHVEVPSWSKIHPSAAVDGAIDRKELSKIQEQTAAVGLTTVGDNVSDTMGMESELPMTGKVEMTSVCVAGNDSDTDVEDEGTEDAAGWEKTAASTQGVAGFVEDGIQSEKTEEEVEEKTAVTDAGCTDTTTDAEVAESPLDTDSPKKVLGDEAGSRTQQIGASGTTETDVNTEKLPVSLEIAVSAASTRDRVRSLMGLKGRFTGLRLDFPAANPETKLCTKLCTSASAVVELGTSSEASEPAKVNQASEPAKDDSTILGSKLGAISEMHLGNTDMETELSTGSEANRVTNTEPTIDKFNISVCSSGKNTAAIPNSKIENCGITGEHTDHKMDKQSVELELGTSLKVMQITSSAIQRTSPTVVLDVLPPSITFALARSNQFLKITPALESVIAAATLSSVVDGNDGRSPVAAPPDLVVTSARNQSSADEEALPETALSGGVDTEDTAMPSANVGRDQCAVLPQTEHHSTGDERDHLGSTSSSDDTAVESGTAVPDGGKKVSSALSPCGELASKTGDPNSPNIPLSNTNVPSSTGESCKITGTAKCHDIRSPVVQLCDRSICFPGVVISRRLSATSDTAGKVSLVPMAVFDTADDVDVPPTKVRICERASPTDTEHSREVSAAVGQSGAEIVQNGAGGCDDKQTRNQTPPPTTSCSSQDFCLVSSVANSESNEQASSTCSLATVSINKATLPKQSKLKHSVSQDVPLRDCSVRLRKLDLQVDSEVVVRPPSVIGVGVVPCRIVPNRRACTVFAGRLPLEQPAVDTFAAPKIMAAVVTVKHVIVIDSDSDEEVTKINVSRSSEAAGENVETRTEKVASVEKPAEVKQAASSEPTTAGNTCEEVTTNSSLLLAEKEGSDLSSAVYSTLPIGWECESYVGVTETAAVVENRNDAEKLDKNVEGNIAVEHVIETEYGKPSCGSSEMDAVIAVEHVIDTEYGKPSCESSEMDAVIAVAGADVSSELSDGPKAKGRVLSFPIVEEVASVVGGSDDKPDVEMIQLEGLDENRKIVETDERSVQEAMESNMEYKAEAAEFRSLSLSSDIGTESKKVAICGLENQNSEASIEREPVESSSVETVTYTAGMEDVENVASSCCNVSSPTPIAADSSEPFLLPHESSSSLACITVDKSFNVRESASAGTFEHDPTKPLVPELIDDTVEGSTDPVVQLEMVVLRTVAYKSKMTATSKVAVEPISGAASTCSEIVSGLCRAKLNDSVSGTECDGDLPSEANRKCEPNLTQNLGRKRRYSVPPGEWEHNRSQRGYRRCHSESLLPSFDLLSTEDNVLKWMQESSAGTDQWLSQQDDEILESSRNVDEYAGYGNYLAIPSVSLESVCDNVDEDSVAERMINVTPEVSSDKLKCTAVLPSSVEYLNDGGLASMSGALFSRPETVVESNAAALGDQPEVEELGEGIDPQLEIDFTSCSESQTAESDKPSSFVDASLDTSFSNSHLSVEEDNGADEHVYHGVAMRRAVFLTCSSCTLRCRECAIFDEHLSHCTNGTPRTLFIYECVRCRNYRNPSRSCVRNHTIRECHSARNSTSGRGCAVSASARNLFDIFMSKTKQTDQSEQSSDDFSDVAGCERQLSESHSSRKPVPFMTAQRPVFSLGDVGQVELADVPSDRSYIQTRSENRASGQLRVAPFVEFKSKDVDVAVAPPIGRNSLHVQKDLPRNTIVCAICQEVCTNKTALLYHMRSAHYTSRSSIQTNSPIKPSPAMIASLSKEVISQKFDVTDQTKTSTVSAVKPDISHQITQFKSSVLAVETSVARPRVSSMSFKHSDASDFGRVGKKLSGKSTTIAPVGCSRQRRRRCTDSSQSSSSAAAVVVDGESRVRNIPKATKKKRQQPEAQPGPKSKSKLESESSASTTSELPAKSVRAPVKRRNRPLSAIPSASSLTNAGDEHSAVIAICLKKKSSVDRKDGTRRSRDKTPRARKPVAASADGSSEPSSSVEVVELSSQSSVSGAASDDRSTTSKRTRKPTTRLLESQSSCGTRRRSSPPPSKHPLVALKRRSTTTCSSVESASHAAVKRSFEANSVSDVDDTKNKRKK